MLKKMMNVLYFIEPKPFFCPKCGCKMIWHGGQGPLGGWKCPNDGLQIDYKGEGY